ncbi:EscU/YscU/HrcU family type III secretion system export apparatus switch protein [Variovorax sp. MHTC-1]|jgi:type III secretion protein U|uniref:EscU/YscU/HrcU family type III secretion system export apparatus switch protein n=1 Tax=Variovorax sp. MHTC-1 TaxID=2495593 RepID=UPI000F87F51A|nr:EscU/YscU/HrcU family type III secretion system export apparatus switch protein [Variovorax sp. MHTC-1]RST56449.1 EscU/YscU/HrcU family type III secretion system export apparatus switch protein [Variovorax sp. MHTC-1]
MAEKNQDPTPKRLRDARKRGEVVFSADVASTLVFAVVIVAMWMGGEALYSLLRELWLHATSATLLANPDQRFGELLLHTGEALLWGTLPITAIAAFAGIAGSLFQVGGVAAWERIKPDANRMNPAEGAKRIFSTRNLVNLVKMVVKTVLLAVLMYVVVRSFLDTALNLGYIRPPAIMSVSAHMVLIAFVWAMVIYALMALVDYAHEHYEFMKQQRMSIDDLRQEYKEVEGDPINQSRRRTAHFEAVYASLADRVRGASAVIHSARTAIALQYLGEHDLPRVIARGEGEVAAQIRRFAGEGLVPMEFEPSLADRLYDEVPVDQPIPRSLYAPVAKLLRWAQGGEAGA